jgi:hypothetical protein
MGRRRLPADREKRRLANKQKRDDELREFVVMYGIHPSRATPGMMAEVARIRRRREQSENRISERYMNILNEASRFVMSAGFEKYGTLALVDKKNADAYKKSLLKRIQDAPSKDGKTVHDCMIEHNMIWLTAKMLTVVDPVVGKVPKVRLYGNGNIEMVHMEDPDAVYISEKMTGMKGEVKNGKRSKKG